MLIYLYLMLAAQIQKNKEELAKKDETSRYYAWRKES